MLDRCLFIYRISLNRTLNDTPFNLLYGRDAVLPHDLCFPRTKSTASTDPSEYSATLVETLKKAYEKLNEHKTKYQNQYKTYYDRSHKKIEFHLEELVMVYFPVAKLNLSYKLIPKFEGPFKIIKKIDQVTYRVQDQANSRRIFGVHVQRLIKYKPFQLCESE